MAERKSPEYKEYVAKLIVEEGRNAKQLSYELELSYSTTLKWVKAYKEKKQRELNPELHLDTPSELRKRIDEFEKRNRELEEENEILKKAMHVFAKSRK